MATMTADIELAVSAVPRRWLVTGGAGFIGSHLVETLLRLNQTVVTLDNFATGYRHNLDEVHAIVGDAAWRRHTLIEGDINDPAVCINACQGIDVVLHEAALGSVPRSLATPLVTHGTNATGFLNMLDAARQAGVTRFVYAASSSTYGDHPGLPKVEHAIGKPLSPYAVTKYLNELYADVYGRCYGLNSIGLRYFNVFGPRQDPNGAYAAVIPRWTAEMLTGRQCVINGDGETSRDFCFVDNVVQANLRAAISENQQVTNQVYNVAVGDRTTLNELHAYIAEALKRECSGLQIQSPRHADFRAGDVRHSLADIGKAREHLGYAPTHDVRAGLQMAMPWYVSNQRQAA